MRAVIPRVGPLRPGTALGVLVNLARRSTKSFSIAECRARAVHSSAVAKAAQSDVTARRSSNHPIPGADGFLSSRVASFRDLDVEASLVDALERAGLQTPACVQEVAVPQILKGKNVVLAAETGSGKTLAYLVPIMSRLLAMANQPEAQQRRTKRLALVLCPNAALCNQVATVANQLRNEQGEPLLRTSFVSSSNPPPRIAPDIVTATPRGLIAFVNEVGRGYGQLWTREGLAAAVQHVVLDEADLLLAGGYEKDIKAILEEFKVSERRFSESVVMRQLDMNSTEMARMSRDMKKALWAGGVHGMVDSGFRLPEEVRMAELERFQRRQYVFVAATMPALTKGDVGTAIKADFPDATWLTGDMLHMSKPQVEHAWVEVDDKGAPNVLVEAVTQDAAYKDGTARTLVFAKDVESAKAIAGLLRHRGVSALEYHKGVPQHHKGCPALPSAYISSEITTTGSPQVERDAALLAMATSTSSSSSGGGRDASSSQPVVLVSTDAAARGIDLPGVSHVIQADFASNAVDFLHRIGRTARAGRSGKVTSLYQQENAALVDAVRQYIADGKPLEGAFSRNRSFSRKLKRYGQFVERGVQGAAPVTATAKADR